MVGGPAADVDEELRVEIDDHPQRAQWLVRPARGRRRSFGLLSEVALEGSELLFGRPAPQAAGVLLYQYFSDYWTHNYRLSLVPTGAEV